MAAYLLIESEITDPAIFSAYEARIPGVVATHGGTYLVFGGETFVVEGDQRSGRVEILEFDDVSQARELIRSPFYQVLSAVRGRGSNTRTILVEGVVSQPT